MRIDVDQARKRAKERVKAGLADRLSDAQREVARELGYASWPALVHALERPTVARFLEAADQRHDRALELLEAAPELRDDPWVALSLGEVPEGIDATASGGPLGRPPLFYVARSRVAADTVAAATVLLTLGADPNGPGGEEWTNLSIACSRGDAALVQLLLAAGADPNDNDSLYHSVEPQDDRCIRLLLEHGAMVPGTNALWHALDFDRIDNVRLLLEHGGDPNESAHWPALHHAVGRSRGPDSCVSSSRTAPTPRRRPATAARRFSWRTAWAATTRSPRCASSARRTIWANRTTRCTPWRAAGPCRPSHSMPRPATC